MASIRPASISRRVLRWLPILVLTLLATALRFYRLEFDSLWDGEPFTLRFAQRGWADFFHYVADFSAHPPLWFVITKLLIRSGWNEWVIRFPAAVVGILTVPALYFLGEQLFDARVGFMAAFLMAISPIDVLYSQNARMYSAFALLAALALYVLWRALHEHPMFWWITFGLVAALGMYTHYLFVLPLGGALLFAAIVVIGRARQQTGSRMENSDVVRSLLAQGRGLIASVIVLGLLYLPWLPTFRVAFLARQRQREAEIEQMPTSDALPRLLMDLSGNNNWGMVFFGLAFALGLIWLWRTKRYEQLQFLVLTTLVPTAAFIVLDPRRLPVRYIIFALPVYLPVIAFSCAEPIRAGIAHVTARVWSRGSRHVANLAWVLIVAIVSLANFPNLPYGVGGKGIFSQQALAEEEFVPWRSLIQPAIEQAQPGDIVLLPPNTGSARQVAAYFDTEFLAHIYSVPPVDLPQVTVWSVHSERAKGLSSRSVTFMEIALQNPSFENGLASWTVTAGAVRAAPDDSVKAAGQFSLRTTMAMRGNAVMSGEKFTVTPGRLLQATMLTKQPVEGFYTVSPQLVVLFFDKDGRRLREDSEMSTRPPIALPASDYPGWYLQVVEGPTPPDAQTAQIGVAFRDYAYGWHRTSWLDHVRLFVERAPGE